MLAEETSVDVQVLWSRDRCWNIGLPENKSGRKLLLCRFVNELC
jgi:hypothetical protein